MGGHNESANGITESDPGARTDLAVWFFFQIAANHVGLPIVVATFLFAKSIKRDPTLVNMCITWIVAGISSCLLLYAGKQTGTEPAHGLCLLQASLLYGTPPMTAVSALALVITVWSSVRNYRNQANSFFFLYIKLAAPYIALFTFAIATSVIGSRDLRNVNRDRRFFYCSVDDNSLTDALAMFTAVICFICLILEVWTAVHIYRAWRAFRAMKKSGSFKGSGLETAQRGLDKQLAIRLFLFSGYIGIAMIFSLISLMSPRTAVPDIFASSIGMAVLIIFGTQMDVFRAWAFWRSAPPRKTEDNAGNSVIRDNPSPPIKENEMMNPWSRPPTPPPKGLEAYMNAQAAPDPFQDSSMAELQISHHHHGHHGHDVVASEVATERNSTDAMSSVRSSLQSRKGNSVIIIQKPGDAFSKLGELNAV